MNNVHMVTQRLNGFRDAERADVPLVYFSIVFSEWIRQRNVLLLVKVNLYRLLILAIFANLHSNSDNLCDLRVMLMLFSFSLFGCNYYYIIFSRNFISPFFNFQVSISFGYCKCGDPCLLADRSIQISHKRYSFNSFVFYYFPSWCICSSFVYIFYLCLLHSQSITFRNRNFDQIIRVNAYELKRENEEFKKEKKKKKTLTNKMGQTDMKTCE